MPLDIANLDAPESESAIEPANPGGTAADGGNGSPNPGASDSGNGGSGPAGKSDTGWSDGSVTSDGDGNSKPAVKAKQDTVPHGALHEARQENKQLKARLAELEGQTRLTAEDAALLQELRAQRSGKKQQETEEEPDFMEDPKGHLEGRFKQILKRLDEADKEAKSTKEQFNQQEMMRVSIDTARAQVSEFVETTKDYPQAIEHVRSMRRGHLEMLYPQATAEQISQAVAIEEINLARQLVSSGQNFAEFAYNYAKRMGYQPPNPISAKKPDASAVRSLGSGGADTDPPETDADDPMNEFREAQKELRSRFKRRA